MICALLSVCVRRVWAIPIFTLQTGLSSAFALVPPVECVLKYQRPSETAVQPLGYPAQDPTSLIAELPFNARAACMHSHTVFTIVPAEQELFPKACATYLYLIPAGDGKGWDGMGWDGMGCNIGGNCLALSSLPCRTVTLTLTVIYDKQ